MPTLQWLSALSRSLLVGGPRESRRVHDRRVTGGHNLYGTLSLNMDHHLDLAAVMPAADAP